MNSHFNIKIKKTISYFLCVLLLLGLTGCGINYEKRYQRYVKSLIAINYLGATKDYMDATGANEADANALYQSNVEMLAKNIQTYYGINIDNAPKMQDKFIELAKNIYSKVNYSVSKAYSGTDSYYVDVTINPINLFSQAYADVCAYVDKFNSDVQNGVYNEYTLEQYETEFAQGLIDILNDACLEMTYAEPVVITAQIITEDDIFYLVEKDFLEIDKAMIKADTKVEN